MIEDSEPQTLALIVGNRDIFPDRLAEEGGKEVIGTLKDLDFEVVTLFSEDSGKGAIQTRQGAKESAELFEGHAEDIDGVVVTLPNFGEERSVVETLQLSDLDVPVLVHAFPDELGSMGREDRRDSFCGKISVCNNLVQRGVKFTNTRKHVESPDSEEFREDLKTFGRVCRLVDGIEGSRLGAIGVRPNPFRTVRYSEKILEREGITVENISLMEIIERARALSEEDSRVQENLSRINDWFSVGDEVPKETLIKTAKLAAVMSTWAEEDELDALSFQCWPAIEEHYETVPCAAMSLVIESQLPVSCESDVMGGLSMLALRLASGKPPALVDLNNNYGDDPEKFVMFHCSAFPKSFFEGGGCKLDFHEMQDLYGSCSGKIASGPITLLRISTKDSEGKIHSYLAEGEVTEEEIETFGSYGVVELEGLQSLMDHIVEEGFEHHTAVVHGHVADSLEEAIGKYLGWDVYRPGSSPEDS